MMVDNFHSSSLAHVHLLFYSVAVHTNGTTVASGQAQAGTAMVMFSHLQESRLS